MRSRCDRLLWRREGRAKAAAEGEVEIDAVFEPLASHREPLGAAREEALLGGEHGEDITRAEFEFLEGTPIGFEGEAGRFGEGVDASGQEGLGGEGILDFAEGREGGLLEVGRGEHEFGTATINLGKEAAALEDRLGEVAGDAPDAEVPREDFADVLAGAAESAGEADRGEKGSFRLEEALVGGRDAAFGGGEIGTAVEKGGGESRRDLAG